MDSGLVRHRVFMGGASSDGMLGTAIFRFGAPVFPLALGPTAR